ncbi:hypothetical protein IVA80_00265 [Bradyrhizobium sp. 139]|uniref:hypothetical protein n=1 Tax=Bradyrhizobium sp. 139 TaxID=2782616 RepID=UPI001FFA2E2B|nr:hypothetical protein [Bradyrhizobium sp. 139]MCK1739345.1 hypothetical protein [Bradyrhizobium sp. 139]
MVPLDERLASRVLADPQQEKVRRHRTGLTGYVGRAEPRVASQHAMLFDVAVREKARSRHLIASLRR